MSTGALPTFLIIGGMKCGTTGLHAQLAQHPDISMSSRKEPNFFATQGTWSQGQTWYEGLFDARSVARGESSTHYTLHPFVQGVPRRAAAMLPDARIVYLVRDPVQRIVSHYLHWVASEREERSFDEVVTDLASELDPVEEAGSLDEHPGYLRRSMYFEQVQQWREVFSDEQITVIDLAELTEDRAATLARLAAFLGVSGRLPPSAARTSQNRSEDMRRVSPLGAHIRRSGGTAVAKALPTSIRRPLAAAFSRTVDQVPPRPIPTSEQIRWIGELLGPDLREFRAYTGRDFGDWCV